MWDLDDRDVASSHSDDDHLGGKGNFNKCAFFLLFKVICVYTWFENMWLISFFLWRKYKIKTKFCYNYKIFTYKSPPPKKKPAIFLKNSFNVTLCKF